MDDESLQPLAEGLDIKALSTGAEYAWVAAESIDWEGCMGHFVQRDPPDKIRLCLSTWEDDDYESYYYVVATHPSYKH